MFSVGSITYCGSLSHNGYDNNISRITRNVLDRFVDPGPRSRPDPLPRRGRFAGPPAAAAVPGPRRCRRPSRRARFSAFTGVRRENRSASRGHAGTLASRRAGDGYNAAMAGTEASVGAPRGRERAEAAEPAAQPARLRRPSPSELAFPGCDRIPMTRAEYRRCERRPELWDAASRTAWMVREAPTWEHERPSQMLAQMAALIAAARGSPIKCYGAMGLVRRAEAEAKRLVLHPDQTVYLHPSRVEQEFQDPLLVVGAQLPRRGPRSGPHHGRAPGQARTVRVVGGAGALGGGPGPGRAQPPGEPRPGADDPSAGGRRVPHLPGEPGVRRLAGEGDPRGDERARALGPDPRDPRTPGPEAGRAGGHRAPRTTIRFCAPCAARAARRVMPKAWRRAMPRAWRKAMPQAWWKAGRRWFAGCCCRAASRFPRDFRPTCPASPNRRKTRRSPWPSPATARRISALAFAEPVNPHWWTSRARGGNGRYGGFDAGSGPCAEDDRVPDEVMHADHLVAIETVLREHPRELALADRAHRGEVGHLSGAKRLHAGRRPPRPQLDEIVGEETAPRPAAERRLPGGVPGHFHVVVADRAEHPARDEELPPRNVAEPRGRARCCTSRGRSPGGGRWRQGRGRGLPAE